MDIITTILNWLGHELQLTWIEIEHQITIPHIITGALLYGIIHKLAGFGRQEEQTLKKRLSNHHDRMRYLHVKKRHKGRFSTCEPCATIRVNLSPEYSLE